MQKMFLRDCVLDAGDVCAKLCEGVELLIVLFLLCTLLAHLSDGVEEVIDDFLGSMVVLYFLHVLIIKV